MLDAAFIVENADRGRNKTASTAASRSTWTASSQLEEARRLLQIDVEELNRQVNEVSKSIGKAKDPAEREARKEEGRQLREKVQAVEAELDRDGRRTGRHPAADPQPLASRRPGGRRRQVEPGTLPRQDAAARSSISRRWTTSSLPRSSIWWISRRGRRVAGHGFYFLKNEAVLLELALQRYAVEVLLREGFTPVCTPDLARNDVLDGIGFIPRGPETQIYSIERAT